MKRGEARKALSRLGTVAHRFDQWSGTCDFDILTTRFPTSDRARCVRWRWRPRLGSISYRMSPRSTMLSQATRQAHGPGWSAKGTAGEIIERLNREINVGLVNPTIKARLAEVAGSAKNLHSRGVRRLLQPRLRNGAG